MNLWKTHALGFEYGIPFENLRSLTFAQSLLNVCVKLQFQRSRDLQRRKPEKKLDYVFLHFA